MWEEGKYYFVAPKSYDEKTIRKKWKEDTSNLLSELKNRIEAFQNFHLKILKKNLNRT